MQSLKFKAYENDLWFLSVLDKPSFIKFKQMFSFLLWNIQPGNDWYILQWGMEQQL